jgi:SAM-dependent methyltransferase
MEPIIMHNGGGKACGKFPGAGKLQGMKPTERFSNRVENYRRFRPSYPAALIEFIRETAGLHAGSRVADVGSGTGILTRLLLDAGWEVFAVEPNAPMRRAAEEEFGARTGFHSVDASAEATGLPAASVDAITCAQAFHWFDHNAAMAEFARILKPEGWAFIIWNERQITSPADLAYSEILTSLGHAYDGVRERGRLVQTNDILERSFRAGTYRTSGFPNPSRMDWETFRGRFLSSSYAPAEDDPRAGDYLARLEALFREHQRDGEIVMDQTANVYCGQLG